MSATPSDDLLSPAAIADPHSFFRELREHDPVHWSARHRAWIVTGHPETMAAFNDDHLSTDRLDAYEARLPEGRRRALDKAITLLRGWMLFHDDPEHDRLRAPIRRAFTARAIEALRPRVTDMVDHLLADITRRLADGETVDIVRSLAHPLPVAVISDLFGLPVEDRWRFAEWSERFAVVVFGATNRPDYEQVGQHAGEEFHEYIRWYIDRRTAEPGDDLISALINGRDDGGFTDDDIAGACSLLLFAGHDTTTSLLGNSIAALADHPDQRERWLAAPALEASAVEELLRFDGPPKAMMRIVKEPTRLGAHELTPGQSVFLALVGANRDPRQFADPDRLDLGRDPNQHVAFGYGSHFCPGAPLARMEARIALGAAVRRLPELRIVEPRTWKPTISDRSLTALHVQSAR